jgi:hypothetical protein
MRSGDAALRRSIVFCGRLHRGGDCGRGDAARRVPRPAAPYVLMREDDLDAR